MLCDRRRSPTLGWGVLWDAAVGTRPDSSTEWKPIRIRDRFLQARPEPAAASEQRDSRSIRQTEVLQLSNRMQLGAITK
jgi:hypothetical protein